MPKKPITVLDIGLHHLAFDSQAKAIKAFEALSTAKFVNSKSFAGKEWEEKEESYNQIGIQLNQKLVSGPELSKAEIVEPEIIQPKARPLKKKSQPSGGRQLLLESRQLRLK